MAAFRFRLAKLLGLREQAERDAAIEFARRDGLVRACAAELAELRTSRQELLRKRDGLQQGRLRPASLGENRFQLIVLERAEFSGRSRLETLRREAEAARLELLERSKARRLLEKLSERRRADHEQAEARRERREDDARPAPQRGTWIAK